MKMQKITVNNKGEVIKGPDYISPSSSPNRLFFNGYVLFYPQKIMMHGDCYGLLGHEIGERILVYGTINTEEVGMLRIYY